MGQKFLSMDVEKPKSKWKNCVRSTYDVAMKVKTLGERVHARRGRANGCALASPNALALFLILIACTNLNADLMAENSKLSLVFLLRIAILKV